MPEEKKYSEQSLRLKMEIKSNEEKKSVNNELLDGIAYLWVHILKEVYELSIRIDALTSIITERKEDKK